MSYRPDFSGCWAKIDRAKEHCDTLKGEVGTISGAGADVPPRNQIGLSLHFDHQSGYHVFWAKAALPDEWLRRWGLIMGDVVHNLRGALDHLVWQLARFHCRGGEPRNAEKVQFPIRSKRPPIGTPLEDFAKHDVLRDVAPEHRAIIEGYQLYNGGYTYGSFTVHPFSWLQRFSNCDKHRVIILAETISFRSNVNTAEIFGEKVCIVDVRDMGYGKRLEPGVEILRMKVVPPTIQRNMDMAGYHTPAVCFPYPGMQPASAELSASPRIPLIAGIDLMSALVVKVIGEFEPLF